MLSTISKVQMLSCFQVHLHLLSCYARSLLWLAQVPPWGKYDIFISNVLPHGKYDMEYYYNSCLLPRKQGSVVNITTISDHETQHKIWIPTLAKIRQKIRTIGQLRINITPGCKSIYVFVFTIQGKAMYPLVHYLHRIVATTLTTALNLLGTHLLHVIVIDQLPRFVCSIEAQSPRDECFYAFELYKLYWA